MVKELRRAVTMAGKKKEEGKEYNGWGGPRPNSGRKKGSKGDRKRRSIWASDEEFEKIKTFISGLRESNYAKQGGQP